VVNQDRQFLGLSPQDIEILVEAVKLSIRKKIK